MLTLSLCENVVQQASLVTFQAYGRQAASADRLQKSVLRYYPLKVPPLPPRTLLQG